MNYYEHHIGDYAEATAHLSFVEDAAYSRLIRKYYAQEKCLPAELKAVQRLIGARSKEEKEAVETVLEEFFELQDDGWHQARCDEEIARYQDKQRKAKASADARWNKTKTQSEGNANASPDAMRTHCEGNAHQTPDTRHQSPDLKPEANQGGDNSQVVGVGDSVATPVEIAIAMRECGVQAQAADPRVIALSQQGVSLDTVRLACNESVAAKPGERIGAGYVAKKIEGWVRDAASLDARGAQAPRRGGYESARDRERRELIEGLTGKKRDEPPPIIDIN